MIEVTKMSAPEFQGDWHDPALKWEVRGPNGESQKFSTKKWACLYASIRRKSQSADAACAEFVRRAA